MDVWFCVPPQEPKTKSALKKTVDLTSNPAPSERGQGFVAFPLTLLIMDVRYADLSDISNNVCGVKAFFERSAA